MGVTALEAYARCPFRFFVSRLLGIEAMEEVEEDLTALDRGTLLHAVVEQFYRERYDEIADRIAPVPADGPGREQAERRLAEIAERQLRALRFSGVFWNAWRDSLLSGLAGHVRADMAPGALKAFLDFEARDRDWCRPRYIESSFDDRAAARDPDPARLQGPPLEITLDDGARFFIKGKVDRIDLAPGSPGLFFVVDYKTYAGKPGVTQADMFDAVNTGRDFQLPVYMILAGRALGPQWRAAGGALYALSGVSKFTGKFAIFGSEEFRDPKSQGGNAVNSAAKKGFVPDEAFDEILTVKVIQNIRAALQAILAGHFNPDILDPKRKQCEYCELGRTCRMKSAGADELREAAASLPGIYLPRPLVTD
jgi:ATP-dependent helicase/nuclease subunit B